MTVTTLVNRLVYFSRYHLKKAINRGMSEEEIKNMMLLQFEEDDNEFELATLLYDQNISETNQKPDAVAIKKYSIIIVRILQCI